MDTNTVIDVSIGVGSLTGVHEPNRAEQLNRKLTEPIPIGLAHSVLVTRAYCNERGIRELRRTHFWLELLAELGVDVLRLVLAAELVQQGKVTQPSDIDRRVQSTRARILERVRKDMGWEPLLLVGKGETAPREIATVSDLASEKLLAALFLTGDLAAVRSYLGPHVMREFAQDVGDADVKSELQNAAQALGMKTPKYETVGQEGPDHEKIFTVRVSVAGLSVTGSGRSKKDAEKDGARQILTRMPGVQRTDRKKPAVFDPSLHVVSPGEMTVLRSAEKLLGFAMNDRRLLSIALTHPSRANEVRNGPAVLSNAVFASLGSQVLRVLPRLVVARDPRPWWERTIDGFDKVQGHVLSERVLGPCARRLGLLSVVQVGRGQSTALTDAIAMETLQACAAAMFLDAGMCLAGERLSGSIVAKQLEELQLSYRGLDAMIEADGRTLLQEVCQSMGMSAYYAIVDSVGPEHARSFVSELTISDGSVSYRFRGSPSANKRSAEQAVSRLPLQVIAAFPRGEKALAAILELGSVAGGGFTRLLANRMLAVVRQGAPGWGVLSSLGMFGADAIVAGTRSEVRRAVGMLHEIFARVLPDGIEELAGLIERGAVRQRADPTEQLLRLSLGLVAFLEGFDLSGTTALQTTPEFRDLQSAAALCSRPTNGDVERMSGQTLRSLISPLRGWTFEFTRGFDTSVEVLADPRGTLEFLNVVFRELTAFGIGPHFDLSLERRGDAGTMIVGANNNASELITERISLLNVLAVGATIRIGAKGVEVSWPTPMPTEGAHTWVDRVVGRVFESPERRSLVLGAFARGAHDLKNLLLAVNGQIENAKEHKDRRFQHLAAAEQNLLTARAAAKQLAASMRPIPTPQYAKFSFSLLMKSFVADLHHRVPPGISLQALQSSSDVQIVGDATLLHAALENLCKNAIEAQLGGGTLKVEWLYDPATSEILVEISDTGPGIPKSVLDALGSGRQITSGKPGGNGLGLASVQQIVSTHGGHLAVKSSSGGTSISILLHGWTQAMAETVTVPLDVVGRGNDNAPS